MKIIAFDEGKGELKVVPEALEDLWHLERVLEAGDKVTGRSFRRFKTDEGESGEKKPVKITLEAEKIEFAKNANRLRVTGKIISGTPEEFVQIGNYHTIDVEPQTKVTIVKEWKTHQLKRLRQAQKETKRPRLQIIALDEEKATFAKLTGYGIEFAFEIHSHSGGKADEKRDEKTKSYYGEIAKKMSESDAGKIVVAGPGFAKDGLKKFIQEKNEELLKKVVFESCSNAERSGVQELLKRGVLEKVAGEERVAKEFTLMEGLLAEIAKDSGNAVYGREEVKKASDYSALKQLYIVDEVLRNEKEMEALAEEAEKKGAEVIIFSSENDAGKQLAGLGGVAGILRFKIR